MAATPKMKHSVEASTALDVDSRAPDEARVAAADAELDEVAARALERLRHDQPDLFDERGRLRQRALRQFLISRADGKARVSKADVLALAAGASPRPHAAK